MRDYGKIAPTFWTGKTGREIRGRGIEGALVGAYLLSSPSSNMLGLYYQPLLYMAHETGLGIEGASKGLQACIDAGFCDYDAQAEVVWVFEMARYQISDGLKSVDKRCVGIQKEYNALPKNRFLGPFFDRYAAPFHMSKKRSIELENDGVFEAPSMPHRSQEQEQEQEQEQKEVSTSSIVDSEKSLSSDRKSEKGSHLEGCAESAENPTGERPPDSPQATLPTVDPPPEKPVDPIPPCPHEQIIALYCSILPMLRKPRIWEGQRRELLKARWRYCAAGNGVFDGYSTVQDGLAFWERYFRFVAKSRTLTDGIPTGDGSVWKPDLPWLLKAENFAKVIEKKYHGN